MASQTASPVEAEVARAKLAELGDEDSSEDDLDARLDSLREIVRGWYPGMRTSLTTDEALDLFDAS